MSYSPFNDVILPFDDVNQECKKGVDSSIGYYCEDTCDPSPCADHEECVLVYTTSCDLGEACGPEATCEQVLYQRVPHEFDLLLSSCRREYCRSLALRWQ